MNEIKPRALTRGEMKALRKNGINLGKLDQTDMEKFDSTVDQVLEMVFPQETVEDMPNPEALDRFKEIVEFTFGGGEAEKN